MDFIKKNLIKIFSAIFISVFFALPSFASDQESISTYPFEDEFYSSLNGVMCQSFIAETDNITGVKLRGRNTYTSNSGYQFEICKGNLIGGSQNYFLSGTYPNQTLKCDDASTQVKSLIGLNFPNETTATGTDFFINFSETQSLTIGDDYYFCFSNVLESELIYLNRSQTWNGGEHNDYVLGYSTNDNSGLLERDLYFTLYYDDEYINLDYEITELPDWGGNIQVGSETILQYNKFNFCTIGQNEDCFLKINYGYDAIGSSVLLLDYEGEIVASSTVEDTYLLQDRFLIDDPESETTQYYCIAIEINGKYQAYCDISLEWITNKWCDSSIICNDVATSSDFLFGFQCGFRQGACWLMSPTQSSIDFFSKSIDNFMNSFPFNLSFGLINEIDQSIKSATTTGASFGIPMYDGDEYYTIYGIDSYSYNEVLGQSTMNTLETYSDYLIYFILAFLITIIIYNFAIINK